MRNVNPWSFCIIGRIGVNAKRPTPMAMASTSVPVSAIRRAPPRLASAFGNVVTLAS